MPTAGPMSPQGSLPEGTGRLRCRDHTRLPLIAKMERPVAVNGQVVIRPMMYVALSYDHRIIDGKESVSFLVRIKDAIEDPQRLLLDV